MEINFTYMTTNLRNNLRNNKNNFVEQIKLSKQSYDNMKEQIENKETKKYLSVGHGGLMQYIIPKFIVDDIEQNNTKWDIFAYDDMPLISSMDTERDEYFRKHILEKYNKFKKNITIYIFDEYFPLVPVINCAEIVDQYASCSESDINENGNGTTKEIEITKWKKLLFGNLYDLMELIDYDPNNHQEYVDLILDKKDSIESFSYKWLTNENFFNSLKIDLFDKAYYFLNKLNDSNQKIYIYIGFYGSGNILCGRYWDECYVPCIPELLAKLYPNLVIIGVDGCLFNNKIIKYQREDHITFTIDMIN